MRHSLLRVLKRREYPALYGYASKWIATPLLGFFTLQYLLHAISAPSSEVYSIGMSAFGVTAALSGICFTMVPFYSYADTAKYAGEKFLHASILLIQTLFIIYLRDELVDPDWSKSLPEVARVLRAVLVGVLTLITTAAGWAWYHGYEEINTSLWKSWEDRINAINATELSSATKPSNIEVPKPGDNPPAGG